MSTLQCSGMFEKREAQQLLLDFLHSIFVFILERRLTGEVARTVRCLLYLLDELISLHLLEQREQTI